MTTTTTAADTSAMRLIRRPRPRRGGSLLSGCPESPLSGGPGPSASCCIEVSDTSPCPLLSIPGQMDLLRNLPGRSQARDLPARSQAGLALVTAGIHLNTKCNIRLRAAGQVSQKFRAVRDRRRTEFCEERSVCWVRKRKPIIRNPMKRRRYYRALEAVCDAVAWLCGLTAAQWITRDVAGAAITPAVLARAALAVCVLSAGTGLLAGLYRGRYQRGSFDELVSVGRAASVMALTLAVLGGALVHGQHAALDTVGAGAVFALLAMVGVRHMVLVARQRSRLTASSGVKVIVFGAGVAGAQLVHSLASQPS